ncbi:intramembrane zinc metalloprotease RseP [Gammaproteobacteria bacterium]
MTFSALESFGSSFVAFVVTLGILVIVHEFGHFWVAKKLGIKVLRFSVGFGKPIWSRKAGVDQTEYALGFIPLGGYVSFLDDRVGSIHPSEAHRAFNRQGIWRIPVVLAGPFANLLLAVLAYWLMFIIGISGLRPILGTVDPATPVGKAGFSEGEEIFSVEEGRTPTWDAVSFALLRESVDQEIVRVETVDPQGTYHHRVLSGQVITQSEGNLHQTGFRPGSPPLEPVLEVVKAGSPAAKAGFAPRDRILRSEGIAIDFWSQWVEVVRSHPGQTLHVEIERAGERKILSVTPIVRSDGGYVGVSVKIPDGYQDSMHAEFRYPFFEALGVASTKVWGMSVLTLKMILKVAEGEASTGDISGPISIAQFAGKAASIGLAPFLAFLGLISLNLGVINLLPIPVLDGGHVMHYLIEAILRKPLPNKVVFWGQKIGEIILFGMMYLAFFNDFQRFF